MLWIFVHTCHFFSFECCIDATTFSDILHQGCTTQILSGPKKLGAYTRAKIDIFAPIQRVFFQQTGWMDEILDFAGKIKSFRGPHLAHGPYVVHVCSRQLWILPVFSFDRLRYTALCRDRFNMHNSQIHYITTQPIYPVIIMNIFLYRSTANY